MFKTTTRPFAQGDRVRTVYGWGEITGEYNNDPKRVGFWDVKMEKNGITEDFHVSEFRHETFLEYCTHPSGFGAHGKVWPVFFALFVIVLSVAGIATWQQDGWVALALAGATTAIFIFMTWRNYQRLTV